MSQRYSSSSIIFLTHVSSNFILDLYNTLVVDLDANCIGFPDLIGFMYCLIMQTRLQAQVAGVPYQNLHSKCRFEPNTGSIFEVAVFPNRIQGFNFLNSSSLLFYCYTKLQIFVLKCCDVGEDIKKFKWLFYCYLPFYP